ncbi:NAD-dependent epimerase/dehydratase family protein [Candidatus Acetothermia bacterium]|nr:NAD-dependent epimerase/dehydratase family protein [Candidatus Acetothermia bacterium]
MVTRASLKGKDEDLHMKEHKRLFITGGTGFVGRHLLPVLSQQGYQVRCLARSATHKRLASLPGIEWIEGDLTEANGWSQMLKGQDALIHLASIHEGSPQLIRRINLTGTENLVSAARLAQIKRCIYLSTITSVDNPKLHYSHSSWLAETLIRERMEDFRILRATLIVGQGDPFLGGLIHFARRWPFIPIIGSGQTKFQPIAVEDVVRCLVQALSEERYSQRTIPIAGPEILSLEQIVDLLQKTLHTEKRKIHLPRRATRVLVSALRRLHIHTQFTSAYFLTKGLFTEAQSVENQFGFHAQSLAEILHSLVEPKSLT